MRQRLATLVKAIYALHDVIRTGYNTYSRVTACVGRLAPTEYVNVERRGQRGVAAFAAAGVE